MTTSNTISSNQQRHSPLIRTHSSTDFQQKQTWLDRKLDKWGVRKRKFFRIFKTSLSWSIYVWAAISIAICPIMTVLNLIHSGFSSITLVDLIVGSFALACITLHFIDKIIKKNKKKKKEKESRVDHLPTTYDSQQQLYLNQKKTYTTSINKAIEDFNIKEKRKRLKKLRGKLERKWAQFKERSKTASKENREKIEKIKKTYDELIKKFNQQTPFEMELPSTTDTTNTKEKTTKIIAKKDVTEKSPVKKTELFERIWDYLLCGSKTLGFYFCSVGGFNDFFEYFKVSLNISPIHILSSMFSETIILCLLLPIIPTIYVVWDYFYGKKKDKDKKESVSNSAIENIDIDKTVNSIDFSKMHNLNEAISELETKIKEADDQVKTVATSLDKNIKEISEFINSLRITIKDLREMNQPSQSIDTTDENRTHIAHGKNLSGMFSSSFFDEKGPQQAYSLGVASASEPNPGSRILSCP